MLLEDIDRVLVEYYRWQRAGCPSDVGYPHADPTQRLRGSTVSSLMISDDEARWIDGALCDLGRELGPDCLRIVEAYYGKSKPPKSLTLMTRAGHGSRNTILRELSNAKSFIKGRLCGSESVA